MISYIKKWVKFLAGCGSIFAFIYLASFVGECWPAYRNWRLTVAEKNIDVSALFYSEEKNTYASEKVVRERLSN